VAITVGGQRRDGLLLLGGLANPDEEWKEGKVEQVRVTRRQKSCCQWFRERACAVCTELPVGGGGLRG